jgi:hypothetical protein
MATISGKGVGQNDLYTLLALLNTKFSALLAKLDADSVIAATNYVSTLAITFPSTITANGISQGAVLSFLENWITKFNACLTKVDADAGAGIDNDYNSTLAITDVINPAVGTARGLFNNGVFQGDLVYLLDTCVTNFNSCLTKLDTDPLGDSNYSATLAITDNVDDTAC